MIDPSLAKYLVSGEDEGLFDILLGTPKDVVEKLKEADENNYKFYGEHIINVKGYEDSIKDIPEEALSKMQEMFL